MEQTIKKIYYGNDSFYIDCTNQALSQCVENGVLVIPPTDPERANIFGDPLFGTIKHLKFLFILNPNDSTEKKEEKGTETETGQEEKIEEKIYEQNSMIRIQIAKAQLQRIVSLPLVQGESFERHENDRLTKIMEKRQLLGPKYWLDRTNPQTILHSIHNNLIITGGRFTEELPEQELACNFLRPNAKVLEIGANIGRNTLVIASILEDQSKFVAVECDPRNAAVLERNKNLNGYSFEIEKCAISQQKLAQRGWDTEPIIDGSIKAGWAEVSTITPFDFKKKYAHIAFDTIVADCEGALYYIVQDWPDIFDNIHTVLLENDFFVPGRKEVVDEAMKNSGLECVYYRSGGFGIHTARFYEAWINRSKLL